MFHSSSDWAQPLVTVPSDKFSSGEESETQSVKDNMSKLLSVLCDVDPLSAAL